MSQAEPPRGAAPEKVLLVAGAAHGIGRALVRIALDRGFSVAAGDLDFAALQAVEAHPRLMTHALDITRRDSVDAFLSAATARFGRIDAAVCNAGGVISLVHEGAVKSNTGAFVNSDPAEWAPIIDLNFRGPLNLAHAILPAMVEQGAGRLVFVTSVAGLVGAAGMALYAATKGGIVALTKSLARELASSGVQVNSVAPGGVETRAFADPAAAARRAERIPMGRLGRPEEIAEAILYFAVDAPDYVTGETLALSGGPP